MKIYIASDHGAYDAKEKLKTYLKSKGINAIDLGPESEARCDYPKYAKLLCKKVKESKEKGILLCGSGIGMSMAANRYSGIRAALCRNSKDASLSVEHNNANVLCMGGRSSTESEIREMTEVWLNARFEGDRHVDRIDQFDSLGEINVSI